MKVRLLIHIFLLCSWMLNGQPFFANQAAQVGIDHSYGAGLNGGGVSFCDFDGDGWDDLTLATTAFQLIKFYRNNNGFFQELPPPIGHTGQAKQVLWADFDNDGDKDLFVATYDGSNRLYENTGDMKLQDITPRTGLPLVPKRTFGACWGDYDRDGWLDLYYTERRIPGQNTPNLNRLFRNNADGTFTEVTFTAGADDSGKTPFCAAFLDYNDDRWPDIYIANDRSKINTLLENNGDGTFTDVSQASGTNLTMEAMCVTVGDYQNDGRQDIYITNTQEGNVLLRNEGKAGDGDQVIFEEVATESGVAFHGYAWGSCFLDADNDGDQDLYVSGMLVGGDTISSAFYENAGDGSFFQPEAGFAGDTVSSFNNAVGDFNQDGYPDIMVINTAPYSSQFWANNGGDHRWLKIQLQGVLSNRDGVGSRIEIFAGDQYQMRYTQCGTGFLGQNSQTEIIGLGERTQADSIRVTWPTGHVDRLTNIAANQKVFLVEGSTTGGTIAVDPDVQLTIITSNRETTGAGEIIGLFPNPVAWSLNLILPRASSFDHYAILDSRSCVIRNGRITGEQMQIDVSDLPRGTYMVVLKDAKGRQIARQWVKG